MQRYILHGSQKIQWSKTSGPKTRPKEKVLNEFRFPMEFTHSEEKKILEGKPHWIAISLMTIIFSETKIYINNNTGSATHREKPQSICAWS